MEDVVTPQRWAARPVEVEGIIWTGNIETLPDSWRAHPNIQWDGAGLTVTTIEGFIGRPDVDDLLIWGAAAEFYWVPPAIYAERWKQVAGTRWVALPVETIAMPWTGRLTDLPRKWRADPHLGVDTAGLWLVTHRGVVSRPRIGDYLVPRTAGKWSWVPKAVFEYKYEQVAL